MEDKSNSNKMMTPSLPKLSHQTSPQVRRHNSHALFAQKILEEEERRTELPPFQVYYDHLIQAAKRTGRRAESLDEYKSKYNNDAGIRYEKDYTSRYEHAFSKTNQHPSRRRIQSASNAPSYAALPFSVPYFSSRHELPRYESARFSMSSLLRDDKSNRNQHSSQIEPKVGSKAYPNENQYPIDSMSDMQRDQHDCYQSDLKHDKSGRFAELRGKNTEYFKHHDASVQAKVEVRHSPPRVDDTRSHSTAPCAGIENTTSSCGMGLLGLTRVANEHLGPVVAKEKKRTKNNNCLHLWQFLRRMLNEDQFNPNKCIEWTNKEAGEFRLVKTAVIADLWGQSKNRKCMTYEKMARAMRYYYKMNILEKVPHKRLHFRFGEKMLPKVLGTADEPYKMPTYRQPPYLMKQHEPFARQSVILPTLHKLKFHHEDEEGKIKHADTPESLSLKQPAADVKSYQVDKNEDHQQLRHGQPEKRYEETANFPDDGNKVFGKDQQEYAKSKSFDVQSERFDDTAEEDVDVENSDNDGSSIEDNDVIE